MSWLLCATISAAWTSETSIIKGSGRKTVNGFTQNPGHWYEGFILGTSGIEIAVTIQPANQLMYPPNSDLDRSWSAEYRIPGWYGIFWVSTWTHLAHELCWTRVVDTIRYDRWLSGRKDEYLMSILVLGFITKKLSWPGLMSVIEMAL